MGPLQDLCPQNRWIGPEGRRLQLLSVQQARAGLVPLLALEVNDLLVHASLLRVLNARQKTLKSAGTALDGACVQLQARRRPCPIERDLLPVYVHGRSRDVLLRILLMGKHIRLLIRDQDGWPWPRLCLRLNFNLLRKD